MKIIVVTDYAFENGGAGRIALESARALAGNGHTVHLFTAVGPVAPCLRGIPGLTVWCTDQFEILNDPNRLRAATQGLWNVSAQRSMRELVAAIGVQDTVAHVHMLGKALSSSVVRVLTDARIPVVMTLHEYLVACPNAGLFNHRTQNICELKPMSAQCWLSNCDTRSYGQKLWRIGRQIVQENFGGLPSRVQDFISISDLSEEILRPTLPPYAKIHRVPNFVEAVRSSPVAVAKNNKFVFSGRLVREKGVMLLAECAHRLQLPALFIGEGDHRAKVEAHSPHCRVTGWLNAAAAGHQLQQARALVFPSLWYETQGLVVSEAAAMGVPSIVSDRCAAREWVVDGETGLLFRNGDIDDLCAKVLRLHEDPSFAQQLGKAAYEEFWRVQPTLKLHTSRLEDVYADLLNRNRNKRGVRSRGPLRFRNLCLSPGDPVHGN